MRRVSEQQAALEASLVNKAFGKPSDTRALILQKALHRAIVEDLTIRQIDVIKLAYIDRLKNKEIAERLGITPSTVSRTRLRAEKRLRKTLRFYIENMRRGED